MTQDTESTDYVAPAIESVTPLLDRAGVTEAFISAPMPIISLVDEDSDYVEAGEAVARNTYIMIVADLDRLRCEKAEIQNRINELVENEKVWGPIIRRLDTGILHRLPDENQPTLDGTD
jgi:hypothetical protein